MSSAVTSRSPGGRTHFAELFAQRFKGGQEIGRLLDDALARLNQVTVGLPTVHGYSHLQTGSDPLTTPTAAPPGVTGAASSAGSGPAYALEDHVHRFDLLTAKGDLVAHNGTGPLALAVGTTGAPLVADAGQATGLRYVSAWKGGRVRTLVNNTVTGLLEVALPAAALCGGVVRYHVRVVDGAGELQSEAGVVTFGATNKGGVYATDVDKGTLSAPAPTSGTLTVTFSVVTGADKVTLSVNANSSLTPTTLDVTFVLDSLDAQAVTFL
jgi:hypothetical protein